MTERDEFEKWLKASQYWTSNLSSVGFTGNMAYAAWQAATARSAARIAELTVDRDSWRLAAKLSDGSLKKAEADRDRLRDAIREAPHSELCQGVNAAMTGRIGACNCWKARTVVVRPDVVRRFVAAEAECGRLRQVIREAPHGQMCIGWVVDENDVQRDACDCWKRNALGGE